MKIVYWQRYPEDNVSSRLFESDTVGQSFYDTKLEDYRYTVGRVWIKTVKVVEVEE